MHEVPVQFEDGEGEGEGGDTCALVCFVVGLVCMFIFVGAIATLIVLGFEDKSSVSSLTSTHPAKPLSPGVAESLLMGVSELRVIDHTPENLRLRELDLLVLVQSQVSDSSLRDVVRKTWMKGAGPSVEVLFTVPARGIDSSDLEQIRAESVANRDMVVFLDAPTTVPESEALLLELTWSTQHRQFSYLLKTRDSMYVRLDVLIQDVVQGLKDSQANAYLGYFQGKENPRNKYSVKHREPEWYLCDLYVRFAHSGGYILSHQLAYRIASLAGHLFPYNNEDVALGTWLSPFSDVDWMHNVHFDTELGNSRGCKNDYIIFPSSHMQSQHERIRTGGPVCLLEREVIQSYTYDFHMPPSKCCVAVEDEQQT